MTEREALKPCPLCGGEAIPVTVTLQTKVVVQRICCRGCQCQVERLTRGEAVAIWNRRPATPAPVAAGEGMVMDRPALLAAARAWWAAHMKATCENVLIKGNGRIEVYWNDGREKGRYTLPVDFVLAVPAQSPVSEGAEIERLRAEIINTPETADFMAGVPLEAAHQRERWGVSHDAGKSPFDWFWLVGYLAQKAASSAVAGDVEKAKHHTISTAAALANWHAALTGADTSMRPGIEPPAALTNGGDNA